MQVEDGSDIIDWVHFEKSRSELGPGFIRILGYFREDGAKSLAAIEHAMRAGELPGLDDARQLTFEAVSFLEAANTRSLLYASTEPYDRAAAAVRARLLSLGADPAPVARIGRRASES